jgi:hypothetical protein
MFYTGINPMTDKEIYCPTDYREKQMQRALLQYRRPENRNMVREALKKCGREDLIGFGKDCLIRPDGRHFTPDNKEKRNESQPKKKTESKNTKNTQKNDSRTNKSSKPAQSSGSRPKGWAKPKPKKKRLR